MSSKPTATGFNYSGSCAQVVGFGPADILHSITNGETVIFQGPIVRQESADIDGKTDLETTIGTIKFYWGTPTQNPDPVLQGLILDQGNGPFTAPMPAFRNLIYAVLDQCQFGAQTTPPTLIFTVSRFPAVFALPGRVTRVRVTNAGAGYSVAPAITFTGGGGSGAAAVAKVKKGKVTSIEVTATGTGYTSTPTVVIGGPPGTGAAATAYRYHELSGDALLPECIYEFLVNKLYGPGIDPANLDHDAFVAATETIIAEDFGVSPNMDELLSVRELIGKVVNYLDAMPIRKNGKMSLLLIRQIDPSLATVLDESDYLEEPAPRNRGIEATQNFVRITFVERDNEWEEGVEPYDNPANAEIQGQSVDKSASYPWITRRSVAKVVAKRVGIKSAIPPFFFDLALKPSHKGIQPGDLVKVNSVKLGLTNRICRVMDVVRAKPSEPAVRVTVMSEQTRDTTHDYVPPPDTFNTPGTTDDQGGKNFDVVSANPRIAVLPTGLKNGKLDGWLTVFGRTSRLIRKAEVWWWPGGGRVLGYEKMLSMDSYPIYAALLGVQQVTPNSFTVRVLFEATSPDVEDFAQLFQEAGELYAVTGQRTIRTLGTPSNIHELMPIWMKKVPGGWFAALTAVVFEMEFTSGEFGAGAFVPETLAAAGKLPTDRFYIARLEEFPIVTTNVINFERFAGNYVAGAVLPGDTDMKRFVKVTLANTRVRERVGDVESLYYDRNDYTMNGGGPPVPITDPAGSYELEWGTKAFSTAEIFDLGAGQYFLLTTAASYSYVADVDDVLGTIEDGTVVAENTFSYPPLDDALGLYSETRNTLYSYNP